MFKKFFLVQFLILLLIKSVFAEKIEKINITGNERISSETVILFSGLKINDDINKNQLNESLKKLYETTFFKNISINLDNNVIIIDLIENPLIQSIKIEGIKKQSLVERLKEILLQKEREYYDLEAFWSHGQVREYQSQIT